MSCPDRESLHQAVRAGAASTGWDELVRHLDGCPSCARAAIALEPTLLFRRLPRLEMRSSDLADLKLSVKAMCKVEALEPRTVRRRSSSWMHAAAIATVLSSAALLDGASRLPEPLLTAHGAAALPVVEEVTAPLAGEGTAFAAFEPAQMPLIEDVDPSLGAPIQLMSGDLSVVLFTRPDV